MEKMVNIVCTRLLEDNLKNQAKNNRIIIHDQTYVSISYNEPNHLKQAIYLNNQSPFLFTSMHGIKASLPILKEKFDLKEKIFCYCIQGATSQLARSLGMEILGEAKNALELGVIIIEDQVKSLLHCTTNIRRTDIYNKVKPFGITIIPLEVYHKELQPIKANSFDGIMFYAPSQIDAFLLVNKLNTNTPAFCIGTTTANHLVHLHHQNIIIAETANTKSILEKIYNYYN